MRKSSAWQCRRYLMASRLRPLINIDIGAKQKYREMAAESRGLSFEERTPAESSMPLRGAHLGVFLRASSWKRQSWEQKLIFSEEGSNHQFSQEQLACLNERIGAAQAIKRPPRSNWGLAVISGAEFRGEREKTSRGSKQVEAWMPVKSFCVVGSLSIIKPWHQP